MDLDLLAGHFANTTTPLLRVDFSDDDAWRRLLGAVTQPVDFNAETEAFGASATEDAVDSEPASRDEQESAEPTRHGVFSDDGLDDARDLERKRAHAEPDDAADLPGEDRYVPNIAPVEDSTLDGETAEFVAASWDRSREESGYVLLADSRSMREARSGGEMTLVYVDLSSTEEDEQEFGWMYGRSFRCAVDEIASIEANLSIANMDFADFADHVADDGVFRGFEE